MGFLPVWEGVSILCTALRQQQEFPPCMGGCIIIVMKGGVKHEVSSLYGRVYRRLILLRFLCVCFLPVWEGMLFLLIIGEVLCIIQTVNL